MLKQLRLASKIKSLRNDIKALFETEERYKEIKLDLEKRSEDLGKALEEAETEEDIAIVEDSITELETESTEFQENKKKKIELEKEVAELEGELEEVPEQPKEKDVRTAPIKNKTRGSVNMSLNKYETRDQMLERLNQEEVRDFYSKVSSAALNKRALADADVTIPEQVINMINTRLGDYSTLYKEVTVQKLNGTARVIMDGAIPEAIWTEMCDPVEELSSAFSQTELDGFKVGGFIPVCNALLEDSMISLATFVEERLAMAIGKSLDKAILIGEGSTAKQPLGVVKALASEATQNVDTDGTLADIVSKMALIDDGEDGAPLGEVIAVMKRSTYYSKIAPQTFLPTATGVNVIQTADSPRLPDGTRIVFSQYAKEDTIILGDFKKYLLGERAGVKLAVSQDVRFIQDQTVFKGTARYDGKPVYNNYFVVITITDTP